MAVPDFQSLMLPLLRMAGDGAQHSMAEAREVLAVEFKLRLLRRRLRCCLTLRSNGPAGSRKADGFLAGSRGIRGYRSASELDGAVRRLAYVDGLPILAVNDDVRALVKAYDKRLGLVGRARADLPHFAFAVAYEVDYLVTWNCAHIANGEIIRRLLRVNAAFGNPFHAVDCNARRNPGTASSWASHERRSDCARDSAKAESQPSSAECNEDLDKLLDRVESLKRTSTGSVVTIETLREKAAAKDPRRLTRSSPAD